MSTARVHILVCSSCGRIIGDKAGACFSCNARYLCSLQARQDIGCLGRPLRPEVESPMKPKKRTEREWKILAAYHDLKRALIEALDKAIGCDRVGPHWHEPCSGNTAIWKDDASGGSSGWDTIVRLVEDHR